MTAMTEAHNNDTDGDHKEPGGAGRLLGVAVIPVLPDDAALPAPAAAIEKSLEERLRPHLPRTTGRVVIAMAEVRTSGTDDTASTECSIFVNYRQRDAGNVLRGHAMFVESLSHHLAQHFGDQQVFIDWSTRSGTDYPKELAHRLAACDVLLVVIHAQWLDDLDARQGTWKDWVHYEISTALNRESKAVVIPVLLDTAELPRVAELPGDIRELALRQTFQLRPGSLRDDLTRLVAELEAHVRPSWPPSDAEMEQPSGEGQPTGPHPTSLGKVLGWALAAFVLAVAAGFALSGQTPEYVIGLSAASIVLMAVQLLITVMLTSVQQRIYQFEWEFLTNRAGRYLLFGLLATFAVFAMVYSMLLVPLANDGLRLVLLSSMLLCALLYIGAQAVRLDHEDRTWPPRVTTRPLPLRRAIDALHERLTSSWRPPLSRLRRDQVWTVYDQLKDAVTSMEQQGVQDRWTYPPIDRLQSVHSHAAWVGGTVGLTVGAMPALSIQGDANPLLYLMPVFFSIIAGTLCLSTMEIWFRSLRKHRKWLIKKVGEDLEKRLSPHMPTRPGNTPRTQPPSATARWSSNRPTTSAPATCSSTPRRAFAAARRSRFSDSGPDSPLPGQTDTP